MTQIIPEKIKTRYHSIIHNSATSGVLLIICTVIALLWANLDSHDSYHHFWEGTMIRIGSPGQLFYDISFHHFVNDFLMAIFFFLTGLEIKREVKAGELSTVKKAMLPISAALGGMMMPALIFVYFNNGLDSVSGWGVPMATDIAFSLGVLALVGTRIPFSLKIFLTALAIADDVGAVVVIAIFYTDGIMINELITAGTGLAIMIIANFAGIRNSLFYYIMGIAVVWVSFMYSGVHATIAGILIAFTIPARTKIDGNVYIKKSKKLIDEFEKIGPGVKKGILCEQKMNILIKQKALTNKAYNPLQYSEKLWHPIVAFLIMPIFALANAGVKIESSFAQLFFEPVFLGIFFGLFVGKLVGVVLFTKLAQWLKLGDLSPELKNLHIIGVGLLAGIGFTMSLFITNLAFTDPHQADVAKQAILFTSFVAAVSGYIVLRIASKKQGEVPQEIQASNEQC